MSWTVAVEIAEPRRLAVKRGSAPQPELPVHLMPAFDRVYEVLRPQNLRLGHNVAIYYGLRDGKIEFEAGVEVVGDFTPTEDVVEIFTPAGRVAHIAYIGPYRRLGEVADALHAFGRSEGRKSAVLPQWEVYGDWTEDESQLRTDVYGLLEAAADG